MSDATHGETMERLEQALDVARSFRPLTGGERRALRTRTATAAGRGELEPFETSSIVDATARNAHWLGDEPARVQQVMPQ